MLNKKYGKLVLAYYLAPILITSLPLLADTIDEHKSELKDEEQYYIEKQTVFRKNSFLLEAGIVGLGSPTWDFRKFIIEKNIILRLAMNRRTYINNLESSQTIIGASCFTTELPENNDATFIGLTLERRFFIGEVFYFGFSGIIGPVLHAPKEEIVEKGVVGATQKLTRNIKKSGSTILNGIKSLGRRLYSMSFTNGSRALYAVQPQDQSVPSIAPDTLEVLAKTMEVTKSTKPYTSFGFLPALVFGVKFNRYFQFSANIGIWFKAKNTSSELYKITIPDFSFYPICRAGLEIIL